MVFDIPELGIGRDRNDSTFCNAWVYALYDAKKEKFQPFSRSFLKNIKRSVNITIIRLGAPLPCKCFFEGFVHWSSLALGVLGIINQAANQIALSLATFTFMFAMGLSVATPFELVIKIGDYKQLHCCLFYILLAVIVESFALIFVLFHKQLPFLC
jgi:MATE family multidrug resistance protein